MAKITYRNEVFTGEVVEETATHYTVEINGDFVSFEKEVTKVENEGIKVKGNRETKITIGKVVTTKTGYFYDIVKIGNETVRVDKYNKEGFYKRTWFTVDTKTGKGGAGLPELVKQAI